MLKIFSLLLLFTIYINAEDKAFEKIFRDLGVEGTLIVTTLNSSKLYVHNSKRADQRFPAASTFKIPHTLIALNEKIILSEDEIIKWDGVNRSYDAWNNDQTLKSAISVSCVWCYKKFAQEISKDKYIEYLEKFNFGNKVIKDKSSFWLNGDLKISAYEQIDFLKKLYSGNLPVAKEHVEIVKNIITVKENQKYEIKAKTGWDGHVGWYVGYIKTDLEVYFFALNCDIDKEHLGLRKDIVHKALKVKGII
jgi:beta-lactamase class D